MTTISAEPTAHRGRVRIARGAKRVRAFLGGEVLADTVRPMLAWTCRTPRRTTSRSYSRYYRWFSALPRERERVEALIGGGVSGFADVLEMTTVAVAGTVARSAA